MESYMGNMCLKKINIFWLVAIAISLVAHGPKYKVPEIKAEYYPQCVRPFKELANAQKALVQRAVLTGAIGAAGGAVIGGLLSGNWKGAVAGGIAGGLVAGMGGYAVAKQKQIKDVKKRLRSYRTDMKVDINNMSHVELYSLLSLQCYIREFKLLLGNYKSHKITEVDFRKRHAEIQHGMKQISTILDDAYNEAVKKDQEFRDAIASERKLAHKKEKENRTIAAAEKKNSKKISAINKANNLAKMERLVNLSQYDSAKNAAQQEIALSVAGKDSGETNIDNISNDFDKEYTSGAARISSTKAMYAKSIDIMNEAAANAGIDMVNIFDTNYALVCR